MTRVDFYILGGRARANRLDIGCRLPEKAWKLGHRVYLHAASANQARQLDKLLWSFRDGSFLPHGLIGEVDPELNPVLVGWQPEAGEEHDVLINLASEVPPFFSRFERVAEPIDQHPDTRDAGRARYRFYRDRGYPLETHKIER